MSEDFDTKLKAIDQLIGTYYAAHGKAGYFNQDGDGKLYLYCTENGFDSEDTFNEEMEHNPDESMIVEFHKDEYDNATFPGVQDDDNANEQIMEIIKTCINNPDIKSFDGASLEDVVANNAKCKIFNVKVRKNNKDSNLNKNNIKLSLIVCGFIRDIQLLAEDVIMLIIDYCMIDIYGSIIMMIYHECQMSENRMTKEKYQRERNKMIQEMYADDDADTDDDDNGQTIIKCFGLKQRKRKQKMRENKEKIEIELEALDARYEMDKKYNWIHDVLKLIHSTKTDDDRNSYDICLYDLDLNDIPKELQRRQIKIDLCDNSLSMENSSIYQMHGWCPTFITELFGSFHSFNDLKINQFKHGIFAYPDDYELWPLYNAVNTSISWYCCHHHQYFMQCDGKNDHVKYSYYGLLTNSIKNDSDILCFSFIIYQMKGQQIEWRAKQKCNQCQCIQQQETELNKKLKRKVNIQSNIKLYDCSKCCISKPKNMFSKTQMIMRGSARKCKQCILNT